MTNARFFYLRDRCDSIDDAVELEERRQSEEDLETYRQECAADGEEDER